MKEERSDEAVTARDVLADKASFGKRPEEEALLLYGGRTFQARE